MDIFNLFAEDEACLFCDGICTCWCAKLGPGSPVHIDELAGIKNAWAVVISINKTNETAICFAKEANVGRQEIPWARINTDTWLYMKIECTNCKTVFNKRPCTIKNENFCSQNCRHDYKWITRKCDICSKEFSRYKCASSPTPLCSPVCAKEWQSKHMSKLNINLNPDRMTLENRLKVRDGRLTNGKHNTKTYKKYLSRHLHRILAEKKIGRKLKKGEVVHHIDGDIHNNSFDNLEVLESQSVHATLHLLQRYAK